MENKRREALLILGRVRAIHAELGKGMDADMAHDVHDRPSVAITDTRFDRTPNSPARGAVPQLHSGCTPKLVRCTRAGDRGWSR